MRSESYLAFKAVSVHEDGKVYSLGMGPAKVIPLSVGEWIKSKEGISAGMTVSHAKKVIYYANRRKTLPIPPNMKVMEILGRGIKFRSSWRIIFKEIMIIPPQSLGTTTVATTSGLERYKEFGSERKVELIKEVLVNYDRDTPFYYTVSEPDPLGRARRALRDIDDIVRREY